MVERISTRIRMRCQLCYPHRPCLLSPLHPLLHLLLLLMSVHLLVATALAFTPPASINIGWTGALSPFKIDNMTINVDATALGQPGYFSYLMAINEANASPDWLPNTTLIPQPYDTRSDTSELINAGFVFGQTNTTLVIGDYADSVTLQNVLKRYRIPQISPNSSPTELSKFHDLLYPYFMRVSYSINTIVTECIRVVLALGYKRAALIYSNEPFAVSGAPAFFEAAKSLGLQLPINPNYIAGETDWSNVISRIVNSKVRIIVYLGNPTDLQSIWTYAMGQEGENNIVGDGYLWILNHAFANGGVTHDSKGKPIPLLQSASDGQVALMLNFNSSAAPTQHFNTLFRSSPYDPLTPTVHPENVNYTLGFTSTFSYDATWLAIRALHQMIYVDQIDPTLWENKHALFNTLVNTSFVGATGSIHINPSGDRTTYFAVANYKRATNSWQRVGYLGPGSPPVIALDPGASFEWPGIDPTQQPPDSPMVQLVVISSNVKAALITITSIIIAFCAGLQILIILCCEDRVLKASSPTFLFIYLIGVQLLCASVIPRTFESEPSTSPSPCNADLYLANIGYTLLVGALLVKTARLQHIFHAQKLNVATRLSDGNLIIALIGLLILEVGMLLGLSEGAPMNIQLRSLSDSENYYVCHTNNQSANELNTIYLPVIMVTRFTLLLVTTVVVFRVRNLPDTFNETKQLGMTIYNLLFLSVLLPAIDGTLGRGQDGPLIGYSVCVFVICILSVCIIFVPKILVMFYKPAGMDAAHAIRGDQTTRPTEKRNYREAPTVSEGSIDLAELAKLQQGGALAPTPHEASTADGSLDKKPVGFGSTTASPTFGSTPFPGHPLRHDHHPRHSQTTHLIATPQTQMRSHARHEGAGGGNGGGLSQYSNDGSYLDSEAVSIHLEAMDQPETSPPLQSALRPPVPAHLGTTNSTTHSSPTVSTIGTPNLLSGTMSPPAGLSEAELFQLFKLKQRDFLAFLQTSAASSPPIHTSAVIPATASSHISMPSLGPSGVPLLQSHSHDDPTFHGEEDQEDESTV